MRFLFRKKGKAILEKQKKWLIFLKKNSTHTSFKRQIFIF